MRIRFFSGGFIPKHAQGGVCGWRTSSRLHPLRRRWQGGALMIDRFFNSRFAFVGILALYAALGWMVAMEVTK